MEPYAQKYYPTYEGIALPEQAERGFMIGMSRVIEGFSSPASLITIGAAGGIGALSNTLRVLITMGFSGMMGAEAIIKAPEIVDHVQAGEYDEAFATGTEALVMGGLAVGLGGSALKGGRSLPAVTGREMILDPRGPGGRGRPLEPRVFEERPGLPLVPAHEQPLFPGRPTELPGSPAAGALAEVPRQPRPGVPGVPSTQGIYQRGTPPEPGVRGLLPEAPGVDVPGAGPGRRFRGGARVGPPDAPAAEPIVTGEQTVTPTGRPQGLFGDEPSNVLRRQRLAPDFVGPPEPPVRPPVGPPLLTTQELQLPPGEAGGVLRGVPPGEPGGLGPFRQGDIVPTDRPGVPARVREPGRFRVREEGDPSSDLLTDEPTVRLEGEITPEVIAEATVEREMTFEEAEAAGKVKVVRAPKSRFELGKEWYAEGTVEDLIMGEGGMKLDLTLEEHARILMQNVNARTQQRSHSMFDPIRARKGEDAMAPDEMFEAIKSQLPARWTFSDFMNALTDRSKVTPEGKRYRGIPSLGMDETADIFAKMESESARRLELAGEVEPEIPGAIEPAVGGRKVGVDDVFVDSATKRGFSPEDGEWGVFRRDPSGQEALINQFRERSAAEAYAKQQLGAYRKSEQAKSLDQLRIEAQERQRVSERPVTPEEPTPLRAEEPWTEADVDTEVWFGTRKGTLYALEEGGKRGVVQFGGETGTQLEVGTSELSRTPPASRTVIDVEPEVFPERVGMEAPEEPGVREVDVERIRKPRERGAPRAGFEPTVEPEGRAAPAAPPGEGRIMARTEAMEYSVIKTPDGTWQPVERPVGTQEWSPLTLGPETTQSASGNMAGAKNHLYSRLSEIKRGVNVETPMEAEYLDPRFERDFTESLRQEDEIVRRALPEEPAIDVEGYVPGPTDRVVWKDQYGTVDRLTGDGRMAQVRLDTGEQVTVSINEVKPAPPKPVSEPGKVEGEFPPEPEVTPEGQVEIVGQKGFERESRLADDKAKLENILSARPDQRTAAGKKQIIELGKREKALRKSIAQQERELRAESGVEQAGMFAEDEPPLFAKEPTVEAEGVKPPVAEKPPAEPPRPAEPVEPVSKASDYVDSLQRAASKPGSPITTEVAGFAKAYLNWKLGDQKLTPPRMAGDMPRSVKGLIDSLVEADKPRGPGGQSTLYSNPIQPAMDWWSKRVGPKIWKYIASTKEPYGVLVKPWPEPVKWLFINRHRQPPTWVEAHKEWIRKTEEGAQESFKLGQQMTRKLSQEDQQLLGRLLKGEANEMELRAMRENPEWQAAVDAVKTARSKFDELGALAAEQKLLQEETFFRNYGRYMPRLYRRWEVDYDAQLRKYGAKKPTRLDMDRFKSRKDIPEEVRVMMGEILEPGYPVAKGLAQLTHDVETSKLFNFVADNPQWTVTPENMVALGKDPKKFTLMPETKKLGRLSGQYVDKYIASELNQMTKPRGELEKLSRRLVSEWKVFKVIFNPPTHGRNMMSNTMLAYLDGLPPWRVDIYSKAISELWQQKGPHYDTAKEAGLFSTTFTKGELTPLIDSWNSTKGGLHDRFAGMAENFSEGKVAEGLGKVLPSGTRAGQRMAKIYQGEEAWFKLARYIKAIEDGATPKQAAAQAQKALFDYTEVPPFVNWARTSPVGAPFITFTYKALPQILETGITHPWRLGALVYGIYAAENAARKHLGIDEDQMEYLKRIMPDRMRGEPLGLGPKALLLPFTDKYGQLQYLDLTYILPWGDIGEQGATGIYQGSPIHAAPMRAIYEITINKSSYTGQEIYGENDSKKIVAQKISDYLYKFVAPSLAPPIPGVTEGGYGFERIWKSIWGKEDYFGRVSAPTTAIASAILGLKTNPMNEDIELFFRKEEFQQGFDEITAAAYKVQNHQGLAEEEKIAQLDELRERMRLLQEAAQTMIYGPEQEQEESQPQQSPVDPVGPAEQRAPIEPQVQPER